MSEQDEAWRQIVKPAETGVIVAQMPNGDVRLNVFSANGNFFFFMPKDVAKKIGESLIANASGLILPQTNNGG